MTRAESYIQEYAKINKAYNMMFDSLQVLIEAEDSDPEVCSDINNALVFLDPVLDRIKEEKDAAIKNSSKDNSSSKGGFKVF
ncbi:hypothetical protein [Treponema sp.]|uniref:hypothetical protein n=1 Tax=Treponema sp. TaxID=166 RepID=UPI0025CE7EC3|nr:hypothetical protein [Treponema sp.]MCR5218704.1 hypothetical protein [Treponema sp.]